MSNGKWSFQDELQRLALSYLHKPPRSVSELFDGIEQAMRPQPMPKKSGFDDFVDDPAKPRTTPEEDMTTVKSRTQIGIYTCPACKIDVFGTVTFAADDSATPQPDDQGYFTVNMRMTGVRVDKHDCTPKVTR